MKKNENKAQANRVFVYILSIVIFLIPLVVYLKLDTLPEDLIQILGTEIYADLFTYYKAQILHIAALILLVMAVAFRLYHSKPIKPDRFVWLMIAFACSVILSYFLSEYKEVALKGSFERYEGTLTWLSYIALAYATYTFVETKKDVHFILGAFVLSVTCISLIGTFQFFGMDIFKTTLGKKTILGSYYDQFASSLEFKMDEGQVYSTLYNPNYIGTIITLAFPLTLFLMRELKRRSGYFGGGIILLLQLITLIGSRSTGGFIGVGCSILILVFYFAWNHSKRNIAVIITTFALIIASVGLFQIPYVHNNITKVVYGFTHRSEVPLQVKEIFLTDNQLKYVFDDNNWFEIAPVEGHLEFRTAENVQFNRYEGERFLRIEIIYGDYGVYLDHYMNINRVIATYFKNEVRSQLMAIDFIYPNNFSIRNIPVNANHLKAESVDFIKNEKAFSFRGYIWNRTLPMIRKSFFWGYGADTFVLNFPDGDLLGRSRSSINYNILVDKPHNLYLQLLLNFGIIGFVLFISMIIISLSRFKFNLLSIAIIGYFITGLVNDSVVYITLIIFVLIGISMGQNSYSIKETKE